jgi:hypothetical protein
MENFNDLIGTRTRDLPACHMAPQQSTLPRGPYLSFRAKKNNLVN